MKNVVILFFSGLAISLCLIFASDYVIKNGIPWPPTRSASRVDDRALAIGLADLLVRKDAENKQGRAELDLAKQQIRQLIMMAKAEIQRLEREIERLKTERCEDPPINELP